MSRMSALGRWSGYIGIAIVFAIACAFLSNWQFERNEARAEQLALVEANYDAPAAALDELVPEGEAFSAADEWRPVLLEGEYLADDQVLVRNRPHGGTSAFEVLVPFRTDDGRIVVVNRGWVRPGVDQPVPDAVPAPPEGRTTVTARLRPTEPLPASGRSAPDGQVPTIHVPLIADALGSGAVVEDAYAIMIAEDPAPAVRPAELAAPTDDPGPHLSYAIQWILFAIMGFIFIGYVIRSEIRARREDREDAAAEAAPRSRQTPAPPRRRDRDADDEDALLDAVQR